MVASLKDELAFRANGFPTAAITPDGSTLIVAWHEKVDSNGLPSPTGSPRIVWKYSKDGGTSLVPAKSDRQGSPRVAARAGVLQPRRARGRSAGDAQHRLRRGDPNRCLVTYYESRPYAPRTGDGPLGERVGRRLRPRPRPARGRLIDAVRPASRQPVVDRRASRCRATRTGPLLGERERPRRRWTTSSPSARPAAVQPAMPALNYSGRPHTGGGTVALHGRLQRGQARRPVGRTRPASGGCANDAADVPFAAAFVAPGPTTGTSWARPGRPAAGRTTRSYGPAGRGGSCVNPGLARTRDVMTAQLSLGLLITAPTNYKPVPRRDASPSSSR